MYVFELAVITAAGILVAGVMGFLFGIGYQKAEDIHEMRHLRKMIKRAYKQGRDDAEKDREQDINDFLDDILKEKNEIKYGGF